MTSRERGESEKWFKVQRISRCPSLFHETTHETFQIAARQVHAIQSRSYNWNQQSKKKIRKKKKGKSRHIVHGFLPGENSRVQIPTPLDSFGQIWLRQNCDFNWKALVLDVWRLDMFSSGSGANGRLARNQTPFWVAACFLLCVCTGSEKRNWNFRQQRLRVFIFGCGFRENFKDCKRLGLEFFEFNGFWKDLSKINYST